MALNPEYALLAEELRWQRGRKEVFNIPSFRLQKGEVTSVIGPNGAGKTSLLITLALLQKPTSGRITINGLVAEGRNNLVLRRTMAVVFQEPLLMRTTVEKNITEGLKIRGLSVTEALRRGQEWMERLNVDHLKKRQTWEISGGEAQRVNLARALAMHPEILLLDEPFNGLDFPSRDELMKSLKNIFQELGTTVLLVTHDPREASILTEKLVFMEQGRIVDAGTYSELQAKHHGYESFFHRWFSL